VFFVVFNLPIISVTNSQSCFFFNVIVLQKRTNSLKCIACLKVWKLLENHRFLITPHCVLSREFGFFLSAIFFFFTTRSNSLSPHTLAKVKIVF